MQKNIRQTILNWLARRDYSQQEITRKLKNQGHTDATEIIAPLVETGLINDERFAENYIYWRRKKGYGPIRISLELQTRGIAEEMIAELIDIANNAWFTEAYQVWQKHFKNKVALDLKTKAKQMRFLAYRGFTREQIESVFKLCHASESWQDS